MSVACRICGEKDQLIPLAAKDYFLGTKREYPYVQCAACNSLSIVEIPSELADLYKNYYSFSHPNSISKIKFEVYKYITKNSNFFSKFLCSCLRKQEDLPIKSFEPLRFYPDIKVLDVGCGSGSLLSLLHKMGYTNISGVDPFLERDIIYPSGLCIKKQEFFHLGDEYDLIMFHHVFEHFSNPSLALRQVHKLLSKDGICIIRMPSVDSFSYYRFKNNWFSIHAPFHISLPSRQGMDMLTKDNNLQIVERVGEQLVEFFFYSMGHELGVSDYELHGNRKFFEEHRINEIPPLHIRNELKDAQQRLKQIKKYDLCDWATYYLKKR